MSFNRKDAEPDRNKARGEGRQGPRLSLGGGSSEQNDDRSVEHAFQRRLIAVSFAGKMAEYVSRNTSFDGAGYVDIEGPAIPNKDYGTLIARVGQGGRSPRGNLLTAAVSKGYGETKGAEFRLQSIWI